MLKYKAVGRISEGAHGVVVKARNLETGEVVALKRVPLRNLESGVSTSALREIKSLLLLDCDNVIKLLDTFPHGSGLVLVFEYMTSDLSVVLRESRTRLPSPCIKSYMLMLLRGLSHCHQMDIVHRDLKPANLLISSRGQLKIGDFGLTRVSFGADRSYSHQVATRWYRAPELLYGARQYNKGVDMWAVGCIFGEMLNHAPLFPGENDIDQLCVVTRILGTPSEKTWPGLSTFPDYNKITFSACAPVPMEDFLVDASVEAVDLVRQLLTYCPSRRITADDALCHLYFYALPLPRPLDLMPKPCAEDQRTSQLCLAGCDMKLDDLDCLEAYARVLDVTTL